MAIDSDLLCTVTGTLLSPLGGPLSGVTVTFTPNVPVGTFLVTTDGHLVTSAPVTATTDADGAFSIALLRAVAFAAGSVSYRVSAVHLQATVRIPDQASVDLSTLV